MVAIVTTTCGLYKTLHMSIMGSNQHVQITADIGFVSSERVSQTSRHDPEGNLVKHIIDTYTCLLTLFQFVYDAFDDLKVRPLLSGNRVFNFI